MAGKIRIGIVGCGNCAWSLAQGIAYYADETRQTPPGLMNVVLGGYRIGDIEIVSAFDVHAEKVGQDVSEALKVAPNNTCVFAELPATGVKVSRGPTLDGIGQWLKSEIPESAEPVVDVAAVLRESRTQVLINYLPVGSEEATRFYIEEALKAGCAVINCIPVFIASDPQWAGRFKAAGLPIIGDDIKSQVGATIVHRALAQLLRSRGVHLDRTYQLNFGGNADFLNMLERERLQSKKISKTRAVTSLVGHDILERDIHVGPSDHVPWLDDRKWAQIRLEGTGFGGAPINIELKLEVWDSPNSAGVVIDAIRCARIGLDRGIGGPLVGPSSYFMKSPPVQFDDHEARARTAAFAEGARDAAE
ncbi:MAG: inositol-3-phosphate synthase [Flavobacteriaceae bacterium]